MRAMKDSGIEWIGQIPQEWNTIRLRSRFSFGKGLPITKADLTESGIGVVSYGQIHSKANIGTTIKPELIRYVDSKYLTTNESSLVTNGDFIFADTSEDISGCGNCVYVDVDYPMFAGYHTMILRPENKPSTKYYSYLFATDAWRSQIRAQASGVKLFSITQKMLRDTLLVEPSEEEKDRIVRYLDEKCAAIDELIAAKEKTNTLLKERRQSIIYEAVTKGLNPDAPMKDSGIEWIGEIPEHWEVERLKHHIEFNPQTEIPEYGEDDSVSFIPMDCLRRGVHTSQTVDYSKVKSGYVDFAEGDILMAKVTPCLENGNLAIAGNLIDGVGFGSTEINVIRCKSIHREYLFYILQCKTYVDRAVADMYGVAGLKRLNPSFIPNTKYPMPSIEEQQGIAEHLAATCGEIDELVVANERTIEKLKEYRQSVIYEAVTGKIEV